MHVPHITYPSLVGRGCATRRGVSADEDKLCTGGPGHPVGVWGFTACGAKGGGLVLRCSLAIQGGTRRKDMKKIYTIYTGIHLQIHADTDKCVPSSPNNDVSGLGVTWASSQKWSVCSTKLLLWCYFPTGVVKAILQNCRFSRSLQRGLVLSISRFSKNPKWVLLNQ